MWLSDLDECTTNTDGCDVNAVCQNSVGSHNCTCKAGYTGNGQTCHGKRENESTTVTENVISTFAFIKRKIPIETIC